MARAERYQLYSPLKYEFHRSLGLSILSLCLQQVINGTANIVRLVTLQYIFKRLEKNWYNSCLSTLIFVCFLRNRQPPATYVMEFHTV